MSDYISDLRHAVDRATDELLSISPERAAIRPSSERWSVKEIVGHLIDSAVR